MMRLLLGCVLLAAQAAALLPQAASIRSPIMPVSRSCSAPSMILGGKTVRTALRGAGIVARLPTKTSSGGDSGIFGNGNDSGGDGGDNTPEPEPSEDPDDGSNPLVNAWKRYNELLDEKPLLMKALTSFTGFALGDILAQKFIQKQPFDWYRLLRLASFGFLVHGTSSHWFYGKLDGLIPGKDAKMVFTKVFIDQVLWNPIFGVMFFSYVALLECKGVEYVVDKTKNELLTQVTGSWKVWPIAHAINFRFIPSSQRVLYINTIQIGYNCFLSLISNRDPEPASA